ncbi:MAG: hypothetical protein O7J95_12315 [Planctomycetota bacterium]|nr:hypothetical protein [Planctomycetota bacterium]
MSTIIRDARLLPPLILSCVFLPSASFAQDVDVELALEPVSTTLRPCDELEVDVVLRVVGAVRVSGYQLFLRFPAEHFEALRFEPQAIDATVFEAGPPPFGHGFPGCVAADPWDDGAGEDVVAVAATVIAEGGGGEPIAAGRTVVGRLVFRPRSGPVAVDETTFRLNTESCELTFQQTTRVFDGETVVVDALLSGVFAVEVLESGPPVENLTCQETGPDEATLSWDPPGAGTESVEVYRNGTRIVVLPNDAIRFVDGVDGVPARRYEVAFVLGAGHEACGRASCEIAFDVVFVRGDANSDDSVNISDPVTVLRHLFQGLSIRCRDAADGNDDGDLNLTDAVFILDHLFRGGGAPPAPFPQPGLDPTDDPLGCEG